jgi:hypothetical protein
MSIRLWGISGVVRSGAWCLKHSEPESGGGMAAWNNVGYPIEK